MKDLDKIWVGLVEENNDPDRLGRIKVRVQSVFDEMPIEDIPWASPMKNISGCSFELPSIGKIVSVVFQNDNLYEPYYMFADHYNTNLQKKLKDLDDDMYTDFFAITFDHRTKIYADDEEMTLDYKYNKITLNNDQINLELKDNQRKLNLGCQTASQQAVLGNHWFDWMDKFVNTLLKPTSLLDSKGAPVLKTEIDQLLIEYKAIRETFVSDHVYIVDDNKVDKLEMKYNAPYMDDGVKINDTYVIGNNFVDEESKVLSDKIKEQKDKSLEQLKETIPTDAIVVGETKDYPDGFSGDVEKYKEITQTDVKDITKQRYDEIKSKESKETGMDVYDAVDDVQDADEIISDMEVSGQLEEMESADTDEIQPDYVYITTSQEKYVDKTEVPKKSKQTNTQSSGGKVYNCSEINNSNYNADMFISKYFTIADLSTKTRAGSHTIGEQKTIDGINYTKYNIACNLQALAKNVLDKIKEKYSDMIVTSGYRNNGGSSQHEKGQAADLQFPNHKQKDYLSIAQWIQSNIQYDQLLFEFRDNRNSVWIHVSYNAKGNRGNDSPYPKYATYHNDDIYKRLQLVNVEGWKFA